MADELTAPAASQNGHSHRGKAKPRLTYAQRALILAIRRDSPDATHVQIAQTANVSERQVYRVLNSQTEDVRRLTQDLMATAITERLDNWAESARTAARKGYHQPSKDWLIAAQAIDPDKPTATQVNTGISVTLAFPLPGVPQSLTPAPATIDVATTPPQSTAQLRDTAGAGLDSSQVEPSLPHAPVSD